MRKVCNRLLITVPCHSNKKLVSAAQIGYMFHVSIRPWVGLTGQSANILMTAKHVSGSNLIFLKGVMSRASFPVFRIDDQWSPDTGQYRWHSSRRRRNAHTGCEVYCVPERRCKLDNFYHRTACAYCSANVATGNDTDNICGTDILSLRFYRAMLRIAQWCHSNVRLSVCPSKTFRSLGAAITLDGIVRK